MGARLLWEQEDFGSTPRYPTLSYRSSRAGCSTVPDKEGALSSILRATTKQTHQLKSLGASHASLRAAIETHTPMTMGVKLFGEAPGF